MLVCISCQTFRVTFYSFCPECDFFHNVDSCLIVLCVCSESYGCEFEFFAEFFWVDYSSSVD